MKNAGLVIAALLATSCAYESQVNLMEHDAFIIPDVGDDIPDIPGDCPGAGFTVPVTPPSPMMLDILVVVDNSMSMAEEQANLAENFPLLIQQLLDPPIDPDSGRPIHPPLTDLHIGIVSTDMGTGGFPIETCSDPIDGDDGVLLNTPDPSGTDCDFAYPRYQSYRSDEPDLAGIDHLSTAFGCLATLGIDGCGFEQPLKAASKALINHRDGANAGFLRRDSHLMILFVTDEEDCSVALGNEGIFDTLDSSLGHLNLRCFHHPYMVEPIESYISAFLSLRSDPAKLSLGFIVGVPRGEQCEGDGDEISTCLEHPDLIEAVDPVSMTRLTPSCVTSTGEAYPPRRMVQIAQQFGDQAMVRSICTDDFRPAISGITSKIRQSLVWRYNGVTALTPVNDPLDPCICQLPCTLIEMVPGSVVCAELGRPCYEPEGPGTGCAYPITDSYGAEYTPCMIYQSGATEDSCAPSPPSRADCDASTGRFSPRENGWTYMSEGWTGPGSITFSGPSILFSEGHEPDPGSRLYLKCCY